MEQYFGQIVNHGLAIAKVFIAETDTINIVKMQIDDVEGEKTRLDAAVCDVMTYLDRSKKLAGQSRSTDGIDIIQTHMTFLSDCSEESIIFKTKETIQKDCTNAEYALEKAVGTMIEEFTKTQNSQYLCARSEDIEHIKNMLIKVLMGVPMGARISEPSIIFAPQLSPEQLTSYDSSLVKGIVTAKGSALSHTAIIAKNMNIPFLTGININPDDIEKNSLGVIDAETKAFITNPDEPTLMLYRKKEQELREKALLLRTKAKELVEKCPISLCANIGKVEEASDAVNNCAAGIGLFRSEFLFLDSAEAPDEQKQYEAYTKVLDIMEGKPVIIRTIDIGADKEAKCLALPKEPNPALGTRGIRISFANPQILKTQLRALLRAAYQRNLRVMFPMISSLWEVQKAIDTVNAVASDLEKEGISYAVPSLGIMVETPAAVMILEDIAPLIDFVSIGTNDLTQYTLGIDRVNDNLSEYYDSHHKAVLSLIRLTAEKAHKYGVQVGICGELGADLELAEEYLKMGIDELSMSPSAIPAMALKLSSIKHTGNDVLTPVDGYLIPMEEIPDAVFSNGLVGKCVGIYPENSVVTSPIDGVVTMIAKTKHAISVRSEFGTEILIHVGIDTVNMNGAGFDVKVSEGEAVKAGNELLSFDIDMIEEAGYCPIVVVVNIPR